MSSVEVSEKTHDVLVERFSNFRTPNLSGISASEFESAIRAKIGQVDATSEGYSESELEKQRDLSIKFHWGHNHDFGTFNLPGRMGNRHFDLFCDFVELFPISMDSFCDKNILDVGCWTGGTTLLLASMGANVVAIEEVTKYASTVQFLGKSFGLEEHVTCENLSIYECNRQEFQDRFDIVYFPGVIYHLSDPVLALRILFNSLTEGGEILIESAGINVAEPYCRFDGNSVFGTGDKTDLSRSGWNWFLPSPSALSRMMCEAGFESVETCWSDKRNRVYGYGSKKQQVGICKAGLSVPGIR